MIGAARFGMMGGGGSLWTPANLTTGIWLDAADASTLTLVDGKISEWRDKSGAGRNFTQTTAAERPSAVTNTLNGLVVADWVNRTENMIGAYVAKTATYWSAFFACKPLYVGSGANDATYIFDQQNDRLAFASFGYAEKKIAYATGPFVYLSADTPTENPQLLGFVLGATAKVYRDGTVIYSGTASTREITNSPLRLGSAWDNSTKYKGWLAEVLLIPQALADENRYRIEGYLAHKWGLTANLPSNHPYKSEPPRV
jgi:hypothetical protein